jgi:hypothetical protein
LGYKVAMLLEKKGSVELSKQLQNAWKSAKRWIGVVDSSLVSKECNLQMNVIPNQLIAKKQREMTSNFTKLKICYLIR